MKKLIILLIALVLMVPMSSFANEQKKKVGYVDITYETKDSFVIKSKIYYPVQKQEVYPMVVFLHSLGYSGDYWDSIVKKFIDNGVAALIVDLRGHGQSAHDSNFKIHSWIYYTPKQFSKYPDDIAEILSYIASNYKNISTTNYAIIGADVGANTAILASEKLRNKPKALALISPSRDFKGLYTPIALTSLETTPVLAMVSSQDRFFLNEIYMLKKFAQTTYEIKTYPHGGTGMMMIRSNRNMADDILNWILPMIKP